MYALRPTSNDQNDPPNGLHRWAGTIALFLPSRHDSHLLSCCLVMIVRPFAKPRVNCIHPSRHQGSRDDVAARCGESAFLHLYNLSPNECKCFTVRLPEAHPRDHKALIVSSTSRHRDCALSASGVPRRSQPPSHPIAKETAQDLMERLRPGDGIPHHHGLKATRPD
jgi:hypothetical protein